MHNDLPYLYCLRYVESGIIPRFLKPLEKAYCTASQPGHTAMVGDRARFVATSQAVDSSELNTYPCAGTKTSGVTHLVMR